MLCFFPSQIRRCFFRSLNKPNPLYSFFAFIFLPSNDPLNSGTQSIVVLKSYVAILASSFVCIQNLFIKKLLQKNWMQERKFIFLRRWERKKKKFRIINHIARAHGIIVYGMRIIKLDFLLRLCILKNSYCFYYGIFFSSIVKSFCIALKISLLFMLPFNSSP